MSTAIAEHTGELWGARKVAEVMGLSVPSVWRYVRWGRLPAPTPVEGSDWVMVWRAEDFLAWMENEE